MNSIGLGHKLYSAEPDTSDYQIKMTHARVPLSGWGLLLCESNVLPPWTSLVNTEISARGVGWDTADRILTNSCVGLGEGNIVINSSSELSRTTRLDKERQTDNPQLCLASLANFVPFCHGFSISFLSFSFLTPLLSTVGARFSRRLEYLSR